MMNSLAEYCKDNLNLDEANYYEPYASISACIIDCIYSLRAKYFLVTVPIVQRFANHFLNRRPHSAGCSLTEFIKQVDDIGFESFSNDILKNRQKLAGRLKIEVCYELAKNLLLLGINTKDDFAAFKETDRLEDKIISVNGIGPAALNYLFMLAGDENRCKPDVHIHHFIRDALGYDVSDDECQLLLTEAVEELKKDYSNMSVRRLDGIVWNKYQAGKKV